LPRLPGLPSGGVWIRRSQRLWPHRPELAQPLLGWHIEAVVRLLAIVPPPAHCYLHTTTAEIARVLIAHRVRAKLRPTAQRWHAGQGAATRLTHLGGAAGKALACGFARSRCPQAAQIQVRIPLIELAARAGRAARHYLAGWVLH